MQRAGPFLRRQPLFSAGSPPIPHLQEPRANRRKAYAQLYRKRKPGTVVFLVCPKDRRVRVKQRAFLRCVKACMNFGFSRQRSQPRRRSAAFQLRVQKIFEPFVGVAARTDCSVYLAEHCSIAEICRKFNILACFFANRTHIIHARRFVRPDDPLITGRPDNVAFTRMVSPIMRGNFLFCIPGDQRISRLSPCPPYKSSQKNQRQQKRQRTRCFRTRNASPAFVRLAALSSMLFAVCIFSSFCSKRKMQQPRDCTAYGQRPGNRQRHRRIQHH